MSNINKTFILVLAVFALCSVCNADVISRSYEISSGYVLKRNWSWGYTEQYYYLSGSLHFTYNIPSYAVFDWVDVELDEEIIYVELDLQTTTSLDELFHMTELQLTDADETEINFVYEKNIPAFPLADVNVTVTFLGGNLLLTGRFSDAMYDGSQYDLYAIATQIRYSGGTGEPNDPYLIATPNDLNDIGNYTEDFNKHFILVNDINLAGFTGTQFNIIGNQTNPFRGVFDGNGHTISNFTYILPGAGPPVALFKYADDLNCVIRDLTLYEPNILGRNYVAALVGKFYNGLVSNSHVVSGKISGNNIVAGLIGWCDSGVITNCSSGADVNGNNGDFAGGLVAVSDADIFNSFATGNVKGYVCVGGLIGTSFSGQVSDCYAQGNAAGHHDIGGFIGSTGSDLGIYRCYAAGLVSGVSYIGGFTGSDNEASYAKCFWDNSVNPDINGIGDGSDPDVTGLSTAQMQQRSTFADAGWDMVNIWDIGENQTYPFLRKHLPGDINKDEETNLYDFAILAENWLKEQ